MSPPVEVIEFTDPACSWAWGSEPKFRLLRWSYGNCLAWRRVMGGLVPDRRAVDPDFDPVAAAPRAAEYWANVTAETHMPYPAQLHYAPTSSIEACIAVKAAEQQGEAPAARLLRRLREACFVFCEPADTIGRVLAVARGVPGLDAVDLAHDVESCEVREAYQADWEETRNPNDYVRTLQEDRPGAGMAKRQDGRWRYVFPTLIFRGPHGEHTVPGWKPYARYLEAMEAAVPGSTSAPRPRPGVEAAFERWPLLTEAELNALCAEAGAPLPAGVIRFERGGGVVWMTPQEAASWPVPAPTGPQDEPRRAVARRSSHRATALPPSQDREHDQSEPRGPP
jgi:predicted DsbA family dithiol-disulfide isomerase